MKHIRKISSVPRADAYTDFLNGLFVLWQDFRFAKKSELTR